MKLKLKRINNKLAFETTNEHGAHVISDASAEIGGENLGLRPMELLATGLASCASIDILLILEKQRQIVEDFKVEIDADRKNEIPSIFNKIDLKFIISGQIDQEKAEKAAKLAFDKYCSVSKILAPTCSISHRIILK